MKFCLKCQKQINENDPEEHWAMIVTKKGPKVIDVQVFHFECWKGFFERSVGVKKEINKKRKI